MTSKNSTLDVSSQTELFPPQSAEGSLVKTSPLRERAAVLKANAAVYSGNCCDWLASCDRGGSSLRTRQRCLLEGLTKYSSSLPRSGMMQNGTVYQLPSLTRLIYETGAGSWPTPVAADAKSGTRSDRYARHQQQLAYAVRLPTPTASRGDYQRKRGIIYPTL